MHPVQCEPFEQALTEYGKSNLHPFKLNNEYYAALKRSGMKRFMLYDLRHTFGSRQGELGTDPYALRDLPGQSGLDMLKCHVHPSDEHKAKAIRLMEAAKVLPIDKEK